MDSLFCVLLLHRPPPPPILLLLFCYCSSVVQLISTKEKGMNSVSVWVWLHNWTRRNLVFSSSSSRTKVCPQFERKYFLKQKVCLIGEEGKASSTSNPGSKRKRRAEFFNLMQTLTQQTFSLPARQTNGIALDSFCTTFFSSAKLFYHCSAHCHTVCMCAF